MAGRAIYDLGSEKLEAVRKNTWTGRPTGSDAFVEHLESVVKRTLKARKPGRPAKQVPVPIFSGRPAK